MTAAPPALEAIGVHAGYGSKPILRGLDLAVAVGQVSLILGANGAGKSTVLKCAAGLVPLHAGEIRLAGRDVTGVATESRVRLGMASVMQGNPVFPSLTVREHLDLGLRFTPASERPAVKERIVMLVPTLREYWTTRAGLLSGGQRQAVALATALAHSPRVLLLDEPTAGLAPALVTRVLDTVRHVTRELSVAVLLVEQRVAEALAIADEAAVLVAGQLAARTGSPADWLHPGALEPFFFPRSIDDAS